MCFDLMKEMTIKEKLLNCGIISGLFASFIILLVVFYWLVYPYQPLVINQRPLKVITTEVKQGDVLIFEMDYCKNTNKPVRISRRFKDTIIYTIPDLLTADNKSGCKVSTITEKIPDNLPTGDYIMTFYYHYQMNPLKEVIVSTHTQKFTVVK